ncbi:transcriptional elongation DNA helicase [Turkeypox virus]|uniref:Transcriptional elongation DNA helicase n=1 Tax=Turkeypox virus TaxID=336486 RepID=A0A0M3ZK47_9POXV|nr:transcriptional elongation DNA helicase [Turkeypox virus]ALA62507.1 transcriptional elongation DNA helicase [Turkeypox virus]
MAVITVIDDKLYSSLRKLVGYSTIYLFTEDGNFVEVVKNSEFKFLIPVGYFSNTNVPLDGLSFSYGKNAMKDKHKLVLPDLYPIQSRVIEEIILQFSRKYKERRPLYMTLHLACGFGKTITASYLVGYHKKNTLISVPNKLILKQWESAIKALGVSYYISYDGVSKLLKVLNTNSFSILVVVDKHLNNTEFCKYVYKNCDVFILDEAHIYNLMNETGMTSFLCYYPPKICYFLTATPRKQNSIYCNSLINFIKFSSLQKLLYIVREYYPEYSNSNISKYVAQLQTPANKYHLYTEKLLAEDINRNKTIVNKVLELMRSNKDNKILVITKLRNHMFSLYTDLKHILGNNVFIGDAQKKSTSCTIKDLRESNSFVLISTLHYAGTGLDIPNLDTLFICNAVMNSMQTEQVMGRICRDNGSGVSRSIFLFINTSIKDIKSLVGVFTQRFAQIAIKLGFREVVQTT